MLGPESILDQCGRRHGASARNRDPSFRGSPSSDEVWRVRRILADVGRVMSAREAGDERRLAGTRGTREGRPGVFGRRTLSVGAGPQALVHADNRR